jgi:hypothetical protein
MEKLVLRIVTLAMLLAIIGCGGEKTPSPEELKGLQEKSEQKANDEEREYQKTQNAANKKTDGAKKDDAAKQPPK